MKIGGHCLGAIVLGALSLLAIGIYAVQPNCYRAECLLHCSIASSRADDIGSATCLKLAVGSEWACYKERYPAIHVIDRLKRSGAFDNMTDCEISNAVVSCQMSQSECCSGLLRLKMLAKDKKLAEEVSNTYVETFKEYLEWAKDARYRKSVALIRAKIEKARRSGDGVDKRLENELVIARGKVEDDAVIVSSHELTIVPMSAISRFIRWFRHNEREDMRTEFQCNVRTFR